MLALQHAIRALLQLCLVLLLLSSCQSVGRTGLDTEPTVIKAKRIAVAEDPSLSTVRFLNPEGKFELISIKFTKMLLAKNATASAVARAIPQSRKTEVSEPIPCAIRRLPDTGKEVLALMEKTDFDLVIQVMSPATSTSMGYFNPAAGAYISGGSSQGGYSGNFVMVNRTHIFSASLIVRVFRGSDGVLLKQFPVKGFASVGKDQWQAGADQLLANVGDNVTWAIFGTTAH